VTSPYEPLWFLFRPSSFCFSFSFLSVFLLGFKRTFPVLTHCFSFPSPWRSSSFPWLSLENYSPPPGSFSGAGGRSSTISFFIWSWTVSSRPGFSVARTRRLHRVVYTAVFSPPRSCFTPVNVSTCLHSPPLKACRTVPACVWCFETPLPQFRDMFFFLFIPPLLIRRPFLPCF